MSLLNRIPIKTAEEIEQLRAAAQVVSRTLGEVARVIGPGVTPKQLDALAEQYIRDAGGRPAFKGYGGTFPASLCVSVNEVVVHGIPNDRPFEEGDIVSVDCGVELNGFYGDHAYTFPIGAVSAERMELLQVTLRCLYLGIEQMQAGRRMGDLGAAIQRHAEAHGYGVVRELVGHGIGRKMHEPPNVPNYGRPGTGPLLKEGMVFAIEPMINMGTPKVRTLNDGWTVVTGDRKPSAHYEHDVAIVDGKPCVLSTFAYVEAALAGRAVVAA